ncbi:MAG TPA: guanylate kinase [Chloroflexota bacterium]
MGNTPEPAPTEHHPTVLRSHTALPPPAGLLFVLSGPSGVGKDALVREIKTLGVDLNVIVTMTTRPRRPAERPGEDYIFVTPEHFTALARAGKLLEWANVYGYLYGTPLAPVHALLERGEDVLLRIDVQGAASVRRRVPQAVTIFLAPPNEAELLRRMRARGTEHGIELERRWHTARHEMAQMDHFDYRVVNPPGHLEAAVHQALAIVAAERLRVHPRRARL